jgi:hypothetical protein
MLSKGLNFGTLCLSHFPPPVHVERLILRISFDPKENSKLSREQRRDSAYPWFGC